MDRLNEIIEWSKGGNTISADMGILISEIEQLRKEKEWLVSTLLGTWRVDIEDEEDCVLRGFILKEMQQALKEIKK